MAWVFGGRCVEETPPIPLGIICVCVNGGEVIHDFTRISASRFGAVRRECNIEILHASNLRMKCEYKHCT